MFFSVHRASRRVASILPPVMAVIGCASEPPPPPTHFSTGAPDASVSDTGPPGACEIATLSAEPVAPQVVFLMDASGSMGGPRWTPAREALLGVAGALPTSWELGLALFPSVGAGEECEVLGMDVVPEAGSVDAMRVVLEGTTPHGSTPTSAAVALAGDTLSLLREREPELARPQAIVLITDGVANCAPYGDSEGSAETTGALIEAQRALGVPTYVVGYELASTGAAARALGGWAEAGGTGEAIYARGGDALADVLEGIVAQTAPCEFEVGTLPEDPLLVRVTVDGEKLAPSEYAIGEDDVSLGATACAAIRDGAAHEVVVVQLCEPDFG